MLGSIFTQSDAGLGCAFWYSFPEDDILVVYLVQHSLRIRSCVRTS